MSASVTLTVDMTEYLAALAALSLAATRAQRAGAPDLAARFRSARAGFEAAYHRALDLDTEPLTPALLRRQI